jgi:pentatricopeptide repeat protein
MPLFRNLFGRERSREYQRGIELFNQGEYEEAADALEKVVAESTSKDSPIHSLGLFYAAEAHAHLGIALFRRGRPDRAEPHFRRALEENPRYPDLYYYLGLIHYARQEWDDARRCLDQAVDLNPEYVEARTYQAILLAETGHEEEASRRFREVLGLGRRRPTHPLTRFLETHLPGSESDIPPLRELKQLIGEESSFARLSQEGSTFFNAGDYRSAWERFHAASALEPGYPDAHFRMGLCSFKLGNLSRATREMRRALERNPSYVDALFYLGIALLGEEEHEEALEVLSRASSLSPGYADVHCSRGIALLQTGRFGEARDELEKAVESGPAFARGHYYLGLAEYGLGRRGEALHSVKRALELEPDLRSEHQEELGFLCQRNGRWEEAVSVLEQARENGTRPTADLLCVLSAAYAGTGRHGEAEASLRRALELEPSHLAALEDLALLRFREGDAVEALRLIDRALEVREDFPDLHKIRGDVLFALDRLEEAQAAYENAVRLHPGYRDAQLSLVFTCRRRREPHRASEVLEDLIRRDPGDPLLQFLHRGFPEMAGARGGASS